jgi:hypothetical protein
LYTDSLPTVDATPYITGNGTYNFAFSTTSNTNITLRLRREKLRLRSLQLPSLFATLRGRGAAE